MNKRKCIDKVMTIVRKEQNSMDFKEYSDIKETLEHCKKMLKKRQSKKTTHKARSKKLTEWRDSWFGKN
tara:strand:- start:1179 stop:1385 length:207 start_codon:yes stop_codon:yes gene_type:complete